MLDLTYWNGTVSDLIQPEHHGPVHVYDGGLELLDITKEDVLAMSEFEWKVACMEIGGMTVGQLGDLISITNSEWARRYKPEQVTKS